MKNKILILSVMMFTSLTLYGAITGFYDKWSKQESNDTIEQGNYGINISSHVTFNGKGGVKWADGGVTTGTPVNQLTAGSNVSITSAGAGRYIISASTAPTSADDLECRLSTGAILALMKVSTETLVSVDSSIITSLRISTEALQAADLTKLENSSATANYMNISERSNYSVKGSTDNLTPLSVHIDSMTRIDSALASKVPYSVMYSTLTETERRINEKLSIASGTTISQALDTKVNYTDVMYSTKTFTFGYYSTGTVNGAFQVGSDFIPKVWRMKTYNGATATATIWVSSVTADQTLISTGVIHGSDAPDLYNQATSSNDISGWSNIGKGGWIVFNLVNSTASQLFISIEGLLKQ